MLVDTNLLVYATFAGAPEHERARGWLEERLAEGEGTVDLCRRSRRSQSSAASSSRPTTMASAASRVCGSSTR